eukprot:13711485-Alexandrium_andersonii.AAC.1
MPTAPLLRQAKYKPPPAALRAGGDPPVKMPPDGARQGMTVPQAPPKPPVAKAPPAPKPPP